MATRTGLPTLRALAKKTCQIYVKFAPIIKVVFSDNPTLIAAVDAVNAACANLVLEINAVEEFEP